MSVFSMIKKAHEKEKTPHLTSVNKGGFNGGPRVLQLHLFSWSFVFFFFSNIASFSRH